MTVIYPKVPLTELASSALTEKVGHDLAALHRLITAIVPGMVERGFGRVVVVGSLHAEGPTAPAMAANGVAGVVALLCGPDAEFVNGARVPVAGGLNHPVSLRRLLGSARP